jgi:hypothetical protein
MTALRFQTLAAFTEAAKDTSDAFLMGVANRLWWAMHYPRTKGHMASDADRAILREWENA